MKKILHLISIIFLGAANAQVDEPISVTGRVVDDETGEAVFHFVEQHGIYRPANEGGIQWGFSQGTSAPTDRFSFLLRWSEGHRWRILADGYLPELVFKDVPSQNSAKPIVRLKRGKIVRGKVLTDDGSPAVGVSVFPIGPRYINLAEGKSWISQSAATEVNFRAEPATTDSEGKFTLRAGGATHVGVSGSALNAWSEPIAVDGETVINLPPAASLTVTYDIPGGPAETEFIYSLSGFESDGLYSSRRLKIKNGESVGLRALTPGAYRFLRWSCRGEGSFGSTHALEPKQISLEPGEQKSIGWVRKKGRRLTGIVNSPNGTPLAEATVFVRIIPPMGHCGAGRLKIATTKTDSNGVFKTELIPLGSHIVEACSYESNGNIISNVEVEIQVHDGNDLQEIDKLRLVPSQ